MSDIKINRGVEVIEHAPSRIDKQQDRSHPYKMVLDLRPPEFMQVTFAMMHGGTERLVVQGKTHAAINQFLDRNSLRKHPRLIRLVVTGPQGELERVGR